MLEKEPVPGSNMAVRSSQRAVSSTCRRRGGIAIVIVAAVAIAATTAIPGTAAFEIGSGSAPGAPACTPEQEQARIADHLSQLAGSGWKLTDAGEAIASGKLVRDVVSFDPTALVMLAFGEGRSAPAHTDSNGIVKSEPAQKRKLESATRVLGHQTAFLYCNYGWAGNIMYWSGATSSTYVNFLDEDIFGNPYSYQTPHRTCSVVQEPCLFFAGDDPPANERVDWGTPYARYASHSIYDSWCSA